MADIGYKILLALLRFLMLIKRAFVALWFFLVRVASLFNKAYTSTLGVPVFKVTLWFQKQWARLGLTSTGLRGLLGLRGTLQILLLVIACGLLYPYSRLYTRKEDIVPGRATLLYSLVGPGDQDFAPEDIIVEQGAPAVTNVATWRQGTISAETVGTGSIGAVAPAIDATQLSVGGTALVKPTILPGNTIAVAPGETGRTTPQTHIVQNGEVIGAIASKYRVSVSTILWANNLSIRSIIRPGDKLVIPPADGVLHTIKRGDSLGKIAKLYGAKTDDIVRFNKLQSDGRDLVVGETIMVPNGQVARATTVPSSARTAPSFSQVSAPPPSIAAPAGSGYIWPAGVHRITQYYGLRHTGVDIAGPIGTALYAAKSGVVTRAQCGWNGGYGCHVIIDHGGGVTTLYGHSSQLLVEVGQTVEQGQVIALMGSTGRSTGSHLHFEVRVNGKRTNPLRYVR